MNRSAGYRIGVALVAIFAGAAAGAFVFKVVGEQSIGSQVVTLGARFGIKPTPGDDSALKLIDKIAPGTKDGFQSAIVTSLAASMLAATAVSIAIREVAS